MLKRSLQPRRFAGRQKLWDLQSEWEFTFLGTAPSMARSGVCGRVVLKCSVSVTVTAENIPLWKCSLEYKLLQLIQTLARQQYGSLFLWVIFWLLNRDTPWFLSNHKHPKNAWALLPWPFAHWNLTQPSLCLCDLCSRHSLWTACGWAFESYSWILELQAWQSYLPWDTQILLTWKKENAFRRYSKGRFWL